MDAEKTFHVRVLDFKYLNDYGHLNFQYLTYEVSAETEKEALEEARKCYLRGEEGIFSEELPFLLKIFSVTKKFSIKS